MEKSAWMENIFIQQDLKMPIKRYWLEFMPTQSISLPKEEQVITTHKRVFGDNRSDVSDYTTTLAVLMKNSGAWGNSGLRQEPRMPCVHTWMHSRKRNLRIA